MLPDSTSSIDKNKKRRKTVSFALDSIDGVPINQADKVTVKAEKKKKVTRKKKVVKKKTSDDDLDLDKEIYPLTHYIKNKLELVNQMFETVKTERIKSLLPEVLKKYTIAEIRQFCCEELEIMSRKRILGVLNGKRNEDISSSGTEDESDTDDKNMGNQPDSTSTELSIEQELAKVRPQSVALAMGATDGVNNVNLASLEILELEMRARAIKKMLDKQLMESQLEGGDYSEPEEGEYLENEDYRGDNSNGDSDEIKNETEIKQEQMSDDHLAIKTEPPDDFTHDDRGSADHSPPPDEGNAIASPDASIQEDDNAGSQDATTTEPAERRPQTKDGTIKSDQTSGQGDNGTVKTTTRSVETEDSNTEIYDAVDESGGLNLDRIEEIDEGTEGATETVDHSAVTQISDDNLAQNPHNSAGFSQTQSTSLKLTQIGNRKPESTALTPKQLQTNNSIVQPTTYNVQLTQQLAHTSSLEIKSTNRKNTTPSTNIAASNVQIMESDDKTKNQEMITPIDHADPEQPEITDEAINDITTMQVETNPNAFDFDNVTQSVLESEMTYDTENERLFDKTTVTESTQRKQTPESPTTSLGSDSVKISVETVIIETTKYCTNHSIESTCAEISETKPIVPVDLELTHFNERTTPAKDDDGIGCVEIDLNDDESLENLDLEQTTPTTPVGKTREKTPESRIVKTIQYGKVTAGTAETDVEKSAKGEISQVTESDKIADELVVLVEKKIMQTARMEVKTSQETVTSEVAAIIETASNSANDEKDRKTKDSSQRTKRSRTPPVSKSTRDRSRSPVSKSRSRRSYTPPTLRAAKRLDDRRKQRASSTDRKGSVEKDSRDRRYDEYDARHYSHSDDRRPRSTVRQHSREIDRNKNQRSREVDRHQHLPYNKHSVQHEQHRSDTHRQPDTRRQAAHDRQPYPIDQRHTQTERQFRQQHRHYNEGQRCQPRASLNRTKDDCDPELGRYKRDTHRHSREDSYPQDEHSHKRSHSDQRVSLHYEKREDGYYRRRSDPNNKPATSHHREYDRDDSKNLKFRRLSNKQRKRESDSPKRRAPPHTRLGKRIMQRGMRADDEPIIRGVVLAETYYSDDDRPHRQSDRGKRSYHADSPLLESDDDIIELPVPPKPQEVVEILDSD